MADRLWMVTVKLPRHPEHDPYNKRTGRCPLHSGRTCTDTLGQHHTAIVEANSAREAASRYRDMHVTRVEEA